MAQTSDNDVSHSSFDGGHRRSIDRQSDPRRLSSEGTTLAAGEEDFRTPTAKFARERVEGSAVMEMAMMAATLSLGVCLSHRRR